MFMGVRSANEHVTDLTANKHTAKSWRAVLPIHSAAEMFPLMSHDELRELGEDIKNNGLKSRIVLWCSSKEGEPPISLLDGRNRLDALEAVGISLVKNGKIDRSALKWAGADNVLLHLSEASGCDPFAFVISANIRRRHLTAKQKRKLIGKLLKAQPDKSDRQIAETVKASHHTVGAVRAEMEGRGQLAHAETRTDTQGREQPAKKPPSSRRRTPEEREAARAAAVAMAESVTAAVAAKAAANPKEREPQAQAAQDVGDSSIEEHARLPARVAKLENEKCQRELQIVGLESEIEELKDIIAGERSVRERYVEWVRQLPKPERIDEIRKLIAEAHLYGHDMPDIPAHLLRRAAS
jgi:ribosomal protein L29